MRKEIYYGLSVILILGVMGTAAAYNNGSGAAVKNMGGHGAAFVDADGDGINDNRPMNRGARMGQGSGFVDANGDGICDHKGSGRGNGGSRNRMST
jgi:hypothetical protein